MSQLGDRPTHLIWNLSVQHFSELPTGLFETVAFTVRFRTLDRYMMGLIPPEDPGPPFPLRNASNPQPESAPRIGVEYAGQPVDFTVDDIIAADGPQVPVAKDAPKTFNMVFVLVCAGGEPVRAASIDKPKVIANE